MTGTDLAAPVNKAEAAGLVATELLDEARIFASAFPDVKSASEALVKIAIGRSLGFEPAVAMANIHLHQGKPIVGYAMLGACVKRDARYDYKLRELTSDKCAIEFFEYEGDEKVSAGVSEYTMKDAETAKLEKKDNYQKSPRNMLFARAMSNGIKWFVPDVVGGAVYVSEEMDLIRQEAAAEPVAEVVATITGAEAEDMEQLMATACQTPDEMSELLLAEGADSAYELSPEGAANIRRILNDTERGDD